MTFKDISEIERNLGLIEGIAEVCTTEVARNALLSAVCAINTRIEGEVENELKRIEQRQDEVVLLKKELDAAIKGQHTLQQYIATMKEAMNDDQSGSNQTSGNHQSGVSCSI